MYNCSIQGRARARQSTFTSPERLPPRVAAWAGDCRGWKTKFGTTCPTLITVTVDTDLLTRPEQRYADDEAKLELGCCNDQQRNRTFTKNRWVPGTQGNVFERHFGACWNDWEDRLRVHYRPGSKQLPPFSDSNATKRIRGRLARANVWLTSLLRRASGKAVPADRFWMPLLSAWAGGDHSGGAGTIHKPRETAGHRHRRAVGTAWIYFRHIFSNPRQRSSFPMIAKSAMSPLRKRITDN